MWDVFILLAHNKYSNCSRGTRGQAENEGKATVQKYSVRTSPRTEGHESPDLKTYPSAQQNES